MQPQFFFIQENQFIIGNTDSMSRSVRTLDVQLSELAQNEQALNILNLESRISSKPNAVEFFTFYLASFTRGGTKARQEYLEQNPVLRVLLYSPVRHAMLKLALADTLVAG